MNIKISEYFELFPPKYKKRKYKENLDAIEIYINQKNE